MKGADNIQYYRNGGRSAANLTTFTTIMPFPRLLHCDGLIRTWLT
jgi:hypothetical protein